jgi:hypothetical protein
MKKLSLAFVSVLAVVGLVGIAPAQAETTNAIAIIDANFDASLVGGDVLEVCVVSESLCARDDKPRSSTQFKRYNHGTIMADIIRANNPGAKIILIRAANLKTSVVTGIGLRSALDWINENRDVHNIGTVSFSYNSGNGARCLPTSPGVKVQDVHADIVNDIAELKAAGTTVFAASGNYGSGDRIDYPACISDVVAVGSTLYRGSQAQSDVVYRGFTYTSDVLKSAKTSLQDRYEISLGGSYPVRVGNTTSVATAITAATSVPVVPVAEPVVEVPAEPEPDPREDLGVSLDEALTLIQAVNTNVQSQEDLDKANADKLLADLKELISEIESVYNN